MYSHGCSRESGEIWGLASVLGLDVVLERWERRVFQVRGEKAQKQVSVQLSMESWEHFIYGWNLRYRVAVKSYKRGFWSQAVWSKISAAPLTWVKSLNIFVPLSLSLKWE